MHSTPIKQRSTSGSPRRTGPTTLETTLNPWTIAAMMRPRRTKHSEPEMGFQELNTPDDDDEIFMKRIPPDTEIQTMIVLLEISMDKVAAEQIAILAYTPPTCDLMEFLFQTYS